MLFLSLLTRPPLFRAEDRPSFADLVVIMSDILAYMNPSHHQMASPGPLPPSRPPRPLPAPGPPPRTYPKTWPRQDGTGLSHSTQAPLSVRDDLYRFLFILNTSSSFCSVPSIAILSIYHSVSSSLFLNTPSSYVLPSPVTWANYRPPHSLGYHWGCLLPHRIMWPVFLLALFRVTMMPEFCLFVCITYWATIVHHWKCSDDKCFVVACKWFCILFSRYVLIFYSVPVHMTSLWSINYIEVWHLRLSHNRIVYS